MKKPVKLVENVNRGKNCVNIMYIRVYSCFLALLSLMTKRSCALLQFYKAHSLLEDCIFWSVLAMCTFHNELIINFSPLSFSLSFFTSDHNHERKQNFRPHEGLVCLTVLFNVCLTLCLAKIKLI